MRAAVRSWVRPGSAGDSHSAHAGADHDMGAALLSDLAYQASWRNDPRTAAQCEHGGAPEPGVRFRGARGRREQVQDGGDQVAVRVLQGC
ncbi:hypothetical protein STENM327S_04624 [Streptomyces tendae]